MSHDNHRFTNDPSPTHRMHKVGPFEVVGCSTGDGDGIVIIATAETTWTLSLSDADILARALDQAVMDAERGDR